MITNIYIYITYIIAYFVYMYNYVNRNIYTHPILYEFLLMHNDHVHSVTLIHTTYYIIIYDTRYMSSRYP